MKQIRQIINSRIANIYELRINISKYNSGEICQADRYQSIVEQKRAQKYRSIRENQILYTMNQASLSHRETADYLYEITVDIVSNYDKEYEKYKNRFSSDLSQNIRKLYSDFFNSHGFQEKSKSISQIFQKGIINLSPAILLGWLSEWSKKIYYEMLQKQIIQSFQKRTRIKPTTQIRANQIKSEFKKTGNIFSTELNKNQSQIYPLSIHSRSTLHSLIHNDLQEAYKLYDVMNLDTVYLKNLTKRNKKQDLLKPPNLQKAIEVLIETTPNKQISLLTKNYLQKYELKYGKITDISPKKRSNFQYKKKIQFLSPLKKKDKKISSTVEAQDSEKAIQSFTQSKLLSPKLSEIEFLKPEEIEVRINKLKLINHNKAYKKNLQFPDINRNRNQIQKKLSFNQIGIRQKLISQKGNKLSFSTMQRNSLKKQLLICEGHNKSKLSVLNNQIVKNKKDSQSKKRKRITSKFIQSDIIYGDQKLKSEKSFEFNILARNRKALIIKNQISRGLKDLYD